MTKLWRASIVIHAPIEHVWLFFDGGDAQLKKILPGLISNTLIQETPNKIGTTYLQKYQERGRVMEYVFTITDYVNTPDRKVLGFHFTIAGAFDVHGRYTFERVHTTDTRYSYYVENTGLKWWSRLLLLIMNSSKIVNKHMRLVKQVSESV